MSVAYSASVCAGRATYFGREMFGDGALVGGVCGEVAEGISVLRVFRIHSALSLASHTAYRRRKRTEVRKSGYTYFYSKEFGDRILVRSVQREVVLGRVLQVVLG